MLVEWEVCDIALILPLSIQLLPPLYLVALAKLTCPSAVG